MQGLSNVFEIPSTSPTNDVCNAIMQVIGCPWHGLLTVSVTVLLSTDILSFKELLHPCWEVAWHCMFGLQLALARYDIIDASNQPLVAGECT